MDYLTDDETTGVAFAVDGDEANIPIDHDQHKFRFTRKWFKRRNQVTFSMYLPFKFASKRAQRKPFRMIQIGVFEGADLIWCCQNLLCYHSGSRALAIDPWTASRKLSADVMQQVEQRASWNLRPWRKRVELVNGYSENVLADLINAGSRVIDGEVIKTGEWDLIVIDGDHHAPAVLADAKNALQLVRPGGWILFDDVRNRSRKKKHVADGLQTFLAEHGDEVKLAWFHRFCNCYTKRIRPSPIEIQD